MISFEDAYEGCQKNLGSDPGKALFYLELMRAAYDDLYRHHKWIPCSNRNIRPPLYEPVLVANTSDVWQGFLNNRGKWCAKDAEADITHWMYIPEPPEVSE
jgi:hypothetical protein